MKTYRMTLTIRAECPSDAEELINGYSGKETDIEIKDIKEIEDLKHIEIPKLEKIKAKTPFGDIEYYRELEE